MPGPQAAVTAWGTSTPQNGTQFVTGVVPVQVLGLNPNRKSGVIQNIGSNNVRIGGPTVTATTGYQLLPTGDLETNNPDVATGPFYVVSEDGLPGLVFAAEMM